MKKLLPLLLALILVLSMTACGGKADADKSAETQKDAQSGQSQPQTADSNTGEAAGSDRKVITDGSKLGVLQTVADQQTFVIKGLYITSGSGQHDYAHVDDVDAFGTDALNREFELNEWIVFYLDADLTSAVSIYLVRNDASTDYAKITVPELESICSAHEYPVLADAVPDAENRGYAGELYVNPDSSQPDLFNAFFAANGQVCYMVQLELIPQDSAQ